MNEPFPGVFQDGSSFYTENQDPGSTVYGEPTTVVDGVEYRRWSFQRSKAAAALKKGLPTFPLQRDDTVLYLGASTGTTVSHVSDIVSAGFVYAVEYAPAVMRKLLQVAEARDNIAPILGDAQTPDEYAPLASTVDVLYQDVAQRNQVDIFIRNADRFLREDGRGMLAIKAASVSSEPPSEVFEEAKERLREEFTIEAGVKLAPFHADHLFLVVSYPSSAG